MLTIDYFKHVRLHGIYFAFKIHIKNVKNLKGVPMLINSNYTVGQYFLASSIINSSFKKKKTKGLWYTVSLIISTVAFTSSSH